MMIKSSAPDRNELYHFSTSVDYYDLLQVHAAGKNRHFSSWTFRALSMPYATVRTDLITCI